MAGSSALPFDSYRLHCGIYSYRTDSYLMDNRESENRKIKLEIKKHDGINSLKQSIVMEKLQLSVQVKSGRYFT